MGFGVLCKVIVSEHSPLWNASRNAAWNCIRHLLGIYILLRKAAKFSGPEVIWDGQWKRGLWSDESNEKCKNQPLWWYGGASVQWDGWSAYTVCEGTIDAEAYVVILERHSHQKYWHFCQIIHHFSQKNVAITNVLVFTCLFILFTLEKHKKSDIPHRTPKMDWTKLLAPWT